MTYRIRRRDQCECASGALLAWALDGCRRLLSCRWGCPVDYQWCVPPSRHRMRMRIRIPRPRTDSARAARGRVRSVQLALALARAHITGQVTPAIAIAITMIASSSQGSRSCITHHASRTMHHAARPARHAPAADSSCPVSSAQCAAACVHIRTRAPSLSEAISAPPPISRRRDNSRHRHSCTVL